MTNHVMFSDRWMQDQWAIVCPIALIDWMNIHNQDWRRRSIVLVQPSEDKPFKPHKPMARKWIEKLYGLDLEFSLEHHPWWDIPPIYTRKWVLHGFKVNSRSILMSMTDESVHTLVDTIACVCWTDNLFDRVGSTIPWTINPWHKSVPDWHDGGGDPVEVITQWEKIECPYTFVRMMNVCFRYMMTRKTDSTVPIYMRNDSGLKDLVSSWESWVRRFTGKGWDAPDLHSIRNRLAILDVVARRGLYVPKP